MTDVTTDDIESADDLSSLTGAGTATGDKFAIWDVSAQAWKSITRAELKEALEAEGVTISHSGNYVTIADPAGALPIQAGNASDPNNYFSNDGHRFYNRAQNAEFARINSTGIGSGTTSPAAKLHGSAADGTKLLGLSGTTKGLRVVTDSSKVTVEGVDNTLVASFQPIVLNGGSQASIAVDGTNVLDFFTGVVRPVSDNSVDFGSGSYRIKEYFGVNTTINSSGRDLKQDIAPASPAERRAAARIRTMARKYRWKDAVAGKGDAARWHWGYIHEDVRDVLQEEGLDPYAYSFLTVDPVVVRERYVERVTRPRMRKVAAVDQAIELRDGRPVLVRREVEREEPAGRFVPVLDEAGQAVLVDRGTDGRPEIGPMLHFVPELEEVEEERWREVPLLDADGNAVVRRGLRYAELEAFLHCAEEA